MSPPFLRNIKYDQCRQCCLCSQVRVEAGVIKTGTPICVPSKEFNFLGILTGIQHNNKDVDTAKKGDEVSLIL